MSNLVSRFLAKFRPDRSPLPGAQRLARLRSERSPQELHDDALAMQKLLALPAADKLFEYAARYVDAAWQNASPDGFRAAQGMAAMLNHMAMMPELMLAEARRLHELEEKANRLHKAPTPEQWSATIERGLGYFQRGS